MPPQVSVIMSVHNGEKYLHPSVKSILCQSLTDFEFIIVDDGSSDSTPQILSEFARQDRRIILIKNETNRGLAVSLNRGLEQTAGKYIARQDADDISHPHRLEKQVDYMENHPEIGILGSAGTIIDEEGQEQGVYSQPASDLLIRWTSLLTNPFLHPSIMLRRETLEQHCLRYDETFTSAQDYDLWSRLLPHTCAANLPEALVQYRIHPRSTTREQRIKQMAYHDQVVWRNISQQLPEAGLSREQALEVRRWLYPDEGGKAQHQVISIQTAHLYLNMLAAFTRRYASHQDIRLVKSKACQQIMALTLCKPLPKGWAGLLYRVLRVASLAAWDGLYAFLWENHPAYRYPLRAANRIARALFKAR